MLTFLSFNVFAQQKNVKKGKSKAGQTTITNNGYRFIHYATGSGDLPLPGDKLYFDIVIKYKDSILQDSKRMPEQPEFEISDQQEEVPNPVVDGLKLCRVGDSIVIFERLDTISNLPPELKNWKEIKYHIYVRSNETVAIRNSVRARENEVAKIIKQDLAVFKAKSYSKVIQTQSGLAIMIHKEGQGAGFSPGESAKVMYYGITQSDGKKFDSSFERGTAFSVPYGAGRVIEGWEEALGILKRGSKATIFVPAALAYGEYGIEDMIAPGADLAFYIEVLE